MDLTRLILGEYDNDPILWARTALGAYGFTNTGYCFKMK